MNPLDLPADNTLLRRFLRFFQIDPHAGAAGREPRQLLSLIVRAFARLPYENFSKIVAFDEATSLAAARRSPDQVLSEHFRWHTGGTCFSLSATLLHLIRALGFRAEPILADRPYGENTHCAILVWIDNIPHIVDPGFLILDPVPVPTQTPNELQTSFNSLLLSPSAGRRVELHTVDKGHAKHRLTFKVDPVDADEFLRVWDSSFDWDMMTYPLATQVEEGVQSYLRGTRLQRRTKEAVDHLHFTQDELLTRIATTFGIDSQVVAKALTIWDRRGDFRGGNSGG